MIPALRRCVHSHHLKRWLRRTGTNQYVTFRPCGLAPLRRLAPLRLCRLVASCCRSWGSTRFTVHVTSRRICRSALLIPVSQIRTFRRIPPVDSRTVSPRPLPPWRCSLFARHLACSRRASPSLHRGSCVCSEDQTVTLVTRLGTPRMLASMPTTPMQNPHPRGTRALLLHVRSAHRISPVARASHQLDRSPKRPSSPPRGGPRGQVHAGGPALGTQVSHFQDVTVLASRHSDERCTQSPGKPTDHPM